MSSVADGKGALFTGYYSGFWRRLAALLVDAPLRFAIGLGLVFLPMRFLVLSTASRYGSTEPNYLWSVMSSRERGVVIALWLFAAVIVPWLYTAMQEASTAKATLGKRLMRIQVTDLKGERISFGRASGRFFGRLLPTFGIGYLMAAFTRRKQALHDLVAGCVLVKIPNEAETSTVR
jgi:uncharacterized RDD family membrane protein YckC